MARALAGVLAGAGILWAAAGIPLAAQERFAETLAVTEVVVPVRVLLDGRPLPGLGRDDFVLLDRGVPQQILGFETIATAAPGTGLGTDRRSGPRRHLLALFDLGFSRRQRLARAAAAMREELVRRRSPGDRVAVGVWGPVSGLVLLCGFTADPRATELALDAVQAILDADAGRQRAALAKLHRARFGEGPGLAGVHAALARELGPVAALAALGKPDARAADGAGALSRLLAPVASRVELARTEPLASAQEEVREGGAEVVRAFGLALAELTALLAELPAPKDLVLLSEGFGGAMLTDARSLAFLEEAFRAARDGGWSIHALDVGGIPGLGEPAFESNSLPFIARAAGGELIENFNDPAAALGRLLERTSLVYVLTFQPSEPGEPGRLRQLEVRLVDPPAGVEIVHRPGYSEPRPPGRREPYEQRVDAARWLLGERESRELEVAVRSHTVSDPLGGTRVPLAVEVSGQSLLAARSRRAGDLVFQALARDSRGRLVDHLAAVKSLDFAALEGTLAAGGVRFVGDLGLPPGEFTLRVMVWNRRGGEVFLGTFPLAVGSASPAPAAPRGSWISVEARRPAG